MLSKRFWITCFASFSFFLFSSCLSSLNFFDLGTQSPMYHLIKRINWLIWKQLNNIIHLLSIFHFHSHFLLFFFPTRLTVTITAWDIHLHWPRLITVIWCPLLIIDGFILRSNHLPTLQNHVSVQGPKNLNVLIVRSRSVTMVSLRVTYEHTLVSSLQLTSTHKIRSLSLSKLVWLDFNIYIMSSHWWLVKLRFSKQ